MISFQENSHLKVAYAEINYNEEDKLFKELTSLPINLEELKKIDRKHKRIEWMLIRKVLYEIHDADIDIMYDSYGKPHFKNNHQHLSISHSKEMIAVAINTTSPTGIDIQYITDKVVRIKSKFLNVIEQKDTSLNPIELTYYWSCKEALFKVYGKKDAFLKDNFFIKEINWDNQKGNAIGIINVNSTYESYSLKMRRIGNYIMAYVLNS